MKKKQTNDKPVFYRGVRKGLLIMKLSLLLIVLGVLQSAASVYAQNWRFSLDENNISIKEVLNRIENQSEFRFFYEEEKLNVDDKFNVKIKNSTITEVLDQLFKEAGVEYKVLDNNFIVLKPAEKEVNLLSDFQQQNKTISGKVTDSSGLPLPGVTIVVKGATRGTITDTDGNYSLPNVPKGATLVFSFVGMRTQEIPVAGKTSINVTLEEETIGIEEVVAVGYGTQKKINITGAVDVISNEQIQNRQSPTVSQLLQGQVPGLDVSVGQSGFQPGATLSLDIRGIGSLNGGKPYVVIDGFPGDMNNLNPDDIESISILKDAAASAIYGARAPYGVILITTKSGRRNKKMTVTYNGSVSINTPQRLPDMPDSYTHARVMNEAAGNLGGRHKYSDQQIDYIIAYQNEDWSYLREALNLPDNMDPKYGTSPNASGNGKWNANYKGYANNNWYDIMYGHSVNQKHNLSLQGGTKKTSYYLSTGFLSQGGVLNFGEDTYKRGNLSAKINTAISDWWDVRYETRFMKSERYFPNGNQYAGSKYSYVQLFHWISRAFPSEPMYTGYGDQYQPIFIRLLEDGGNDRVTTTENWQILATELRPAKGWKINADFAYKSVDLLHNNVRTAFYYESSVDRTELLPGYRAIPNSIKVIHQSNYYWSSNAYTSYELSLKEKHNFFVLAGAQFETARNNSLSAMKKNMIVQDVPSLQTATGDPEVGESLSHWATEGYFSRFSYNYDEKYLFESNIRMDGTSKFRKGNRWGFFPSFSLGWVISKERIWEPVAPYINYLKFRGSWGSLGNQNINAYLDLPLIPLNMGALNWIFNYGETKPLGYTNTPSLVSPSLTWETATTKNLGANMALLNQRLQFDFDWFERSTTNMIGPSEVVPGVLGTSVPRSNNATLRTRGWEVVLKWKDRVSKDLSYFINLNLYDNKSVVTKFNNPTKSLWTWYEGAEVGAIWGYTTDGLFKSQEEVDAHLAEVDQSFIYKKWRPGDVIYKDIDNDGKIGNGAYTLDDHGDLSIIGNSTPHYQFGISAGVNYKGFDFSILCKGTAKRELYYNTSSTAYWGFNVAFQSDVMTKNFDYFRDKPGDKYTGLYSGDKNINLDAFWPKPYLNRNENTKNRKPTDRYLANASYMRVQNVQLGYNLPQKITSKMKLAKLRIYFSGDNLLTLTKLPVGIDPVASKGYNKQAGKTYGPDRMYSLGLTITY